MSKMKRENDTNEEWTRDEVLWKENAWPLPPTFFDGGFPELRRLARMTDKEIEEGYFAAIAENTKHDATLNNIYFAGTALFFRGEMARRLENERIAPSDKENTKQAIAWCVNQWKTRKPRPKKMGLAREAVDKFLPHLGGDARARKIRSVKTAFSKKL